MQIEQNDEIDLISLVKTILDGKWIIIITTIITSIIGYLYTFSIPNSYQLTSTITNYNQDVFIKYKSLNDIIKESIPNVNNFENEPFQINANLIFNMFVNEFNDYEEMISVLSKNKFVSDKIKNLDDYEKRKVLVSLSSNFKVSGPKKKDKDKIYFRWHDVDEGIQLFDKASQLTLINVKNRLLMYVKSLASSIDSKNQRKKNSIKNELDVSKKIYDLTISKRILFLTEHSNIAKELGIKDNFGFSNLTKVPGPKFVLPPPRGSSFPYYLHGYNAIDKEIELIKKRSSKEIDLMSKGYIENTKNLLFIEKDNLSDELRDAAKIIIDDNIKKWISFNLEFADIENMKKQNQYLFFSLFVGLVISIFYVLIVNYIREKRN